MGWLTGDSPQDQMNLVNQQVDKQKSAWDAYLKQIQAAVGGSGYDFFAPKTTTTTGTQNTTGTTHGTSKTDMLTMPVISDDYKELEGLARGAATDRLKQYSALPPGYRESNVRRINETFAGADAAARNLAAKRGLGGEQTFGLASPIESARAGKIADFLPQADLTERDLRTQDIDLASKLTDMFGKGTHATGTTESDSTSQSSGTSESLSTLPPDIRDFLAYLGMLQPYQTPIVMPQPRQGALGGLLQLGASLPWGKWF